MQQFTITIKDRQDNIILIINNIHHITHEPIKNYTYLWKDSEEISTNYIGLIDNQYANVCLYKKGR